MSEETRVLTVNLSRVYWGRRSNRAARAVRYLKEWIKRRLRAEQVLIEEGLNKLIWSRGIEKPPRKVKVKVVIEEKRETTTESGKKQVVPVRVRVGLVETEGTRQA
uniref:Large ribosomal subunit protein eL31 n=1 Tax=Fervidicoccus fontis TaxID=683846 RepID=A0A7J3ZJ19_9CREN